MILTGFTALQMSINSMQFVSIILSDIAWHGSQVWCNHISPFESKLQEKSRRVATVNCPRTINAAMWL